MRNAIFTVLFAFIFLAAAPSLTANAEIRQAPQNEQQRVSASEFMEHFLDEYDGIFTAEDGMVYDVSNIKAPKELKKYWDGMSIVKTYNCKDPYTRAKVFCFDFESLSHFKETTRAVSVHHIRPGKDKDGMPAIYVLGIKYFYIEEGGLASLIFRDVAKKEAPKDRCTLKEPCSMSPCNHPKDKCEHKQQESDEDEQII